MCDLKRLKLFWYEQLPYVDVTTTSADIINRTGIVYDFFRESVAECCGAPKALTYEFKHEQLQHQQAVLNAAHASTGRVGMPISLDAEFPHTPHEFVPVLATDGLFWVKVTEPVDDTQALQSISTTALPVLLVVITLTGYAALILWLLELGAKKHPQFSRSFVRGMFEAYWYTFISATTIGYGDKVAQTYAGKIFILFWILFGICLVSLFTAIITTVMASILVPMSTSARPFYDEFIGVLEGSLDYLVLVKKSANSIMYPDISGLLEALNNGSIFNIVMDKHSYWIYRAKIMQNQSFEFRPGVQNPTSVGYIYSTNNITLLRCLKDYAMEQQVAVTLRLEELISEAVSGQEPPLLHDESSLFGPHTYSFLGTLVGLLLAIVVIGGVSDFVVSRLTKRKRKAARSESIALDESDKNGLSHDEGESGTDELVNGDASG